MATGDLLKHAGAAPVVIGATGGSGTRALRKVLEIGGVFMGDAVNVTGDAMAFEPLYDQYINAVLTETGGLDYRADTLSTALRRALVEGLRAAANRHLSGSWTVGAPWGWKTPRAMYLLPMIAEVFPQFQFIHMIRDGRDMATAGNQLQRDKHAAALFGAADGDPRVTAARLWAKANGEAADWAARRMLGRYHRVIFETLCREPEIEIARLFVALDLPLSRVAPAARLIDRPDSIGRWQRLDAHTQNTVDGSIAVARQRFGFAPAGRSGDT